MQMINRKIKDAKGVTLVALVITVVVLMILTNIVIYNIRDSLKLERLKAMQNDIANLRDKIASYYAQNGKIPAHIPYTKIEEIEQAGVISNTVDTGEFLIIDLSSLETLTLNYGKDYEIVKQNPENAQNYKNLYIINETSHNIFYVEGVNYDGEIFYTDYTAKGKDLWPVNLRYKEGIKIPEDFSYVEGTKDTGILIRSNSDATKQYQWIPINKEIKEIPNDISILNSKKEDFIKSANAYQGYYKSTQNNSKEVLYLELENWSKTYDQQAVYKDKNGETAYIPANFQVSKTPGQNTINQGLVIRNEQTKDQYIWIQVPKSIYTTATSKEDYENIEKDMKMYANIYTNESNTDTWYDGCGIETEAEYLNLKNRMLASIYEKGGFWIGQYEVGLDNANTEVTQTDQIQNLISKNGQPLMQQDKYPYNYVTCSQAQQLAQTLGKEKSYQTSLMFGIQWDLVCKFIETNTTQNRSDILKNSTSWGNYKNQTFSIIKGRYTNDPALANLWETINLNEIYTKPLNNAILLTTGVTNRNSVLNLYDLAGNVGEWTLEKSETGEAVYRGGDFESDEIEQAIAMRKTSAEGNKNIGFRIALYE